MTHTRKHKKNGRQRRGVILLALTEAEHRIVKHAAAIAERPVATFGRHAVVQIARAVIAARVEAAQVALVADALRRRAAEQSSGEEASRGTSIAPGA